MLGIYIHIPFCAKRCPFCDFTLVAGAPNAMVESYMNALVQEVWLQTPELWPTEVVSVFFGGGTPSLIPAKWISEVLTALSQTFSVSQTAEVTLEANPEDVTVEKALAWKAAGVNRISLGAQSTSNDELRRLGRIHGQDQIRTAFAALRSARFENCNVDLLFGLENQSIEGFEKSLHDILTYAPEHISTYNLTVEKNTAYDREVLAQTLTLPSDDLQSRMMDLAKTTLRQGGYIPYEVSNAAKPGYESRHNLLYWTGKPYLGLGISAHSFHISSPGFWHRWKNTKNIPTYVKQVQAGILPLLEKEKLSQETYMYERVLTGLRLWDGLDLDQLRNDGLEISASFERNIHKLVDSGHLLRCGSRVIVPQVHIPVMNEIVLRLLEG